MAKRIPQPSYRSGDVKLSQASSFIYEVSLYKIYPDRAECIDSQFYSAAKPLTVNKECTVVKNKKFTLMKTIAWLAAPLDYLENNNFKLDDGDNRKSNPKRNKKG